MTNYMAATAASVLGFTSVFGGDEILQVKPLRPLEADRLDVTDRMGVYLEYLGIAGDHAYEAYASGGVTWAFTEMFQWDAGLVLGLNDDAEDLNTFSGFTVKF